MTCFCAEDSGHIFQSSTLSSIVVKSSQTLLTTACAYIYRSGSAVNLIVDLASSPPTNQPIVGYYFQLQCYKDEATRQPHYSMSFLCVWLHDVTSRTHHRKVSLPETSIEPSQLTTTLRTQTVTDKIHSIRSAR